MTTVHESADYTFRIICERDWADEQLPYSNAWKLTITEHELPDFIDNFDGVPGFDSDLLARVVKDGYYFIVTRDIYGMWFVEQFPTFAERNQLWDKLAKEQNDDTE